MWVQWKQVLGWDILQYWGYRGNWYMYARHWKLLTLSLLEHESIYYSIITNIYHILKHVIQQDHTYYTDINHIAHVLKELSGYHMITTILHIKIKSKVLHISDCSNNHGIFRTNCRYYCRSNPICQREYRVYDSQAKKKWGGEWNITSSLVTVKTVKDSVFGL